MSQSTYQYNSSVPANEPSLCIPMVFTNVTEDRIIRCWEVLLGADNSIERVDRIALADGTTRVYIHFHAWPNTPNSNEIRARILSGETCKIVYDEPWWWNVTQSRTMKPRHNNGVRPKPYLERSADILPPPPTLGKRSVAESWGDSGKVSVERATSCCSSTSIVGSSDDSSTDDFPPPVASSTQASDFMPSGILGLFGGEHLSMSIAENVSQRLPLDDTKRSPHRYNDASLRPPPIDTSYKM
jgi:hypothetical protein